MAVTTVQGYPRNKQQLAEIYSAGVQQAMARRVNPTTFEACTDWFYCKDFFQDAVWGHINNKRAGIWGMSYTPGKDPKLDDDRLIIMMRPGKGAEAKDFAANARVGASFLRQLEAVAGFTKTRFRSATLDGTPVAVFEADARWMHHPALLSLYTLACRVTLTYKKGTKLDDYLKGLSGPAPAGLSGQQSNDRTRLNTLYSSGHLMHLLEKNVALFAKSRAENYPAHLSIGTVHNGGVMTWKSSYVLKK